MGSAEGVIAPPAATAGVRFTVLVPARYASSRLPAKALADIRGKPMVVRVAERARRSGAQRVVVATDDSRIAQAVRSHGHDAIMTRADHASGTDRVAEAASALGLADDEIVVNVQGDEPLLDPALMRRVAVALEGARDAAVATACHPIGRIDEAFNPNVVKVVLDARRLRPLLQPCARSRGRATIFPGRRRVCRRRCRSTATAGSMPIAWHSCARSRRCRRPRSRGYEALEQLRALWHGYRIVVEIAEHSPAPGVDTPEDLAQVRALVRGARERRGRLTAAPPSGENRCFFRIFHRSDPRRCD